MEVLQGKREDGAWRTAIAKEYPPLLNKALSFALLEAFRDQAAARPGVVDPPVNFAQDFQRLMIDDDQQGQVMQPDYAKIDRHSRTDRLS